MQKKFRGGSGRFSAEYPDSLRVEAVVELAQMPWYLFPDGRRVKRLWEGTPTILTVCEHTRSRLSTGDERGAIIIFPAMSTPLCRVLWSEPLQFPYQTVIQLVKMLSMMPLWKAVMMDRITHVFLNLYRKQRCC